MADKEGFFLHLPCVGDNCLGQKAQQCSAGFTADTELK
jgi:hypothetical protein